MHQPSNQPRPLQGKVILITRAREQADEFATLVADAGGEPMLFPLLEILPPQSWDACNEAIRRLHAFDGILLTSANGAKYFLQRLTALDIDCGNALENKAVYVVGERTRSVVSSFGVRTAELPPVYDSRHLVELLIERGVEDKQFLLPKGNRAGSEIREGVTRAGGRVEEIVVYETVSVAGPDEDLVAQKLRDGAIDVVTFFSPSSFGSFVERLGRELLEKARVAAIGATTAEAIRRASVPVHVVAKEPTARGMLSSLIDCFSNER